MTFEGRVVPGAEHTTTALHLVDAGTSLTIVLAPSLLMSEVAE